MTTGNFLNKWVQDYRESVLAKRMVAVLGIDILVKASGIIFLPIYLRLMNQEEFGLYNYILSIVLTFSVVLNFGLYIPLSKLYHDCENESARGRLLFSIFLMLVIALSVVMIPVYFFKIDYLLVNFLFNNPIDYEKYRLGILLSVLATVFSFMLTNFFYTSEKINHLKKYNILRIIGINAITMGVLYSFSNADQVFLRLLASSIIELCLIALFYYFFISEMHPRFSLELIGPSFKLGMPVMISAVLGIVINFSDKFFLEKYGTLNELSVYYLAISFSGILATIYAAFQNSWLPLFFKEKDVQRNFDKTKKFAVKLLIGFTILAVVIMVLMIVLLSTNIIQPKYSAALWVLPILLVTQIIAALVPVYSNYLVYFEKTYYTVLIGVVVCCINLSLSFLLIPPLGMYGAAMVSLVSNLCYLCAYFLISRSFKRHHLQLSTSINE